LLYFSFLTGCHAELMSVFGNTIDCTSVNQCIFVCESEEEQLSCARVLKSLSLAQGQSGIETMLETADGTISSFADSSLWLGCSSFGNFKLNAKNIDLVQSYLNLGNLVNPANGKIEWPRKNAKRQKVLAYAAQGFNTNARYTEDEVNMKLENIHDDYALLRRVLVVAGRLCRMRDGSEYWLNNEYTHNSRNKG